jgi:hypothetical protein
MVYTLGKNTTKNLESILISGKKESVILVDAVKDFINYTPIDFTIINNGGYRTAEMQRGLFFEGRSKCDGTTNFSKHQKGLAVDLVPWVDGKATWDIKKTFYLAGAFMSYCKDRGLPITSGAFWDFEDPCHMQIAGK